MRLSHREAPQTSNLRGLTHVYPVTAPRKPMESAGMRSAGLGSRCGDQMSRLRLRRLSIATTSEVAIATRRMRSQESPSMGAVWNSAFMTGR